MEKQHTSQGEHPFSGFELLEKQRASARKYNNIGDEIHRFFQDADQDAYESWLMLDEPIPEEPE